MTTNMDYVFRQIAELQTGYQKLIDTRSMTKKALCDLCVPFRDEYNLKGSQVLQIARKELDISEIIELFERREQ